MQIKFRAPDPRAGTIAQMDSSRGQFFIDSGAAVLVKDGGGDPATTQPEPVQSKKAPEPEPKKAAEPATKAKK
jgi:hypothetical protein